MLDGLLILSRSLSGARQGGLLADTLDLVLASTGCSRGAAYAVIGDALDLVGEHGLDKGLRASLQRLPLTGAPWFVAQRAAQGRKLLVDRELASAQGGPLDRGALAAARWEQAAACPITAGREVLGVMMLAWPAGDEPAAHGLAVVEIACNLAALHAMRLGDEQRRAEGLRRGVHGARMTGLGMLAGGFAEDLGAELAEIARRLGDQHRLVEMLREKSRGSEGAGPFDGLAARTTSVKGALQVAREKVARFLAANRPGTPERLDLACVAADALALVGPRLRSRNVTVNLRASEGHFVVGRRGELIQLFVHVLLEMAGALDADEARAGLRVMIPRAFVLEVSHRGGYEVVRVHDAVADGAPIDLFDEAARVDDHHMDFAVAQQIVIAHEGHLEVGPAGVRSIVLPSADRDVKVAEPRAAGRVPPMIARRLLVAGARPVVLWIDEEELFLEIMTQSLQECDVRVARSSAQAAQALASGMNPALIFCNVHLSDQRGHELHADVARRSPTLGGRFVFVTDGVLVPEVASYLIASGRPTLMRPIDLDQVRALIASDPASPRHAAGAPTLLPPPAQGDDGRRAMAPPAPNALPGARSAPTESALPAVRPDRRSAPTEPDPSSLRLLERRVAPTEPDPSAFRLPAQPPPMMDGVGEARKAQSASAKEDGSGPPPPPIKRAAMASVPEGGTFESSRPPSLRDQELTSLSRITADVLRRDGPRRGAQVLTMLRDRGLSEPEALSVLTFALSTGAVVRDLPPSTVLRAPDSNERRTVLIVDDDFDLRQTLREVLHDEGYTVETAANGREALQVLRQSASPPVVVLDLMMPVMDGWQFLDELKRDDALADVPVVVISASKIGVRAAGAREILSKPLDYYKLVTTIDRSAICHASQHRQ